MRSLKLRISKQVVGFLFNDELHTLINTADDDSNNVVINKLSDSDESVRVQALIDLITPSKTIRCVGEMSMLSKHQRMFGRVSPHLASLPK
jgi:hypothetical protein